METGIQNPNIMLRKMNDAEYNEYVRHVIGNDEIYLQYGYEPTEILIDTIQEMNPFVIYYSVIEMLTGFMVGYVGLSPESNDLEYYIFKEQRRKGYGSASVRSFLNECFAGHITGCCIKKIEAETLGENSASVELLEKLGFCKKAVSFKRMSLGGKEQTAICCRYEITAE